MKRQNKSLISLVTTALCIALCVVLPMALHTIPNAGTLFSPMHIPVLLCGLICGWPYGLFCGLVGPLLSHFITGMPVSPMLPTMMLELAVYGLVTGLCIKLVRTKRVIVNVYVSLVAAMLLGRIVTGIARALIFAPGAYSIQLWAAGYFVKSFPGIILQLVFIPLLYMALRRAKVIS